MLTEVVFRLLAARASNEISCVLMLSVAEAAKLDCVRVCSVPFIFKNYRRLVLLTLIRAPALLRKRLVKKPSFTCVV